MDKNKKEEQIKQIKILFIVLLIVIGIAIFVNTSRNKNDTSQGVNQGAGSSVDMTQVVIDGLTRDDLENVKSFMDNEKYEEYKDTFEKIEKGELQYEEGMSLEAKEEGFTNENIDEQNKKLDEQLSNSSWHYYVSEDGTVTNTIVYDDIDFHDSEE